MFFVWGRTAQMCCIPAQVAGDNWQTHWWWRHGWRAVPGAACVADIAPVADDGDATASPDGCADSFFDREKQS